MSYTRNYHETVSGSRTVSVSYPASEQGGSRSVTVDVDIPVNISISVNTSQFDRSVADCAGGVNTLTGAVVATSGAQVAAITTGAQKVADTILNGFFKLIRSELTQQIAENRPRCEALMLKLNDMKVACLARKSQMESDFSRIADRYTKLFEDLDHELRNRIRAIDGATFSIRDEATFQQNRVMSAGASAVPTVIAGEDNQARTNLGLCTLRNDAMALLHKAGAYLNSDRRLNQNLRSILDADDCGAVRDRHLPVVFAEMLSGGTDRQSLVADSGGFKALGSAAVVQQLTQSFRQPELPWVPMDRDTQLRIETFLRNQISATPSEAGNCESRVGEMIIRLWQAQRPVVLKGGTAS